MELAGLLGAPLKAVTVRPPPAGRPTEGEPYSHVHDTVDPLVEAARRRGLDASSCIVYGEHPAREIVRVAKKCDAYAIAMASHLRDGFERFREGAATMDVTHDTTALVLAVPVNHPAQPQ
jgi:nucleotide-binding universal stress UspA family protein